MTAWSACPTSVRTVNECLNTSDWQIIVPFNTKLTISGRTASTVFDRFNYTIIDVINLSPATPTHYTAEDFFTFYDIIFAVNESMPDLNWAFSTQYQFLLGIATFLNDPTLVQAGADTVARMTRLYEFLATPVFLFNNAVFGNRTNTPGASLSVAGRGFQVLPLHKSGISLTSSWLSRRIPFTSSSSGDVSACCGVSWY